jgi:peptide/nickel transport system permease protein
MAAVDTTEAGAPVAPVTHARWRETLGIVARNRLALLAMIVLGLLVLAALFGPQLAPYGYNEVNVPDRFQAPSAMHVFGTDNVGRDIFSRVLLGSRVSLLVGFVAVGISLTAGTVLGLVAGFYGGRIDDLIMRLMDVLFAFPAMLMAIAVLAILGPGTVNAMVAIGIVYTPIFARVTRGSVLTVREEVHVRAARSIGANDARLLGLHILPNVLAPIIVQTSISLAFAILSEAALSFLGLGTPPPNPSWGRMLSEGREFIQQGWWIAVFPGLAIFFTVLSFNVLGDAMRDALDPRQRSAIESRGMTA